MIDNFESTSTLLAMAMSIMHLPGRAIMHELYTMSKQTEASLLPSSQISHLY